MSHDSPGVTAATAPSARSTSSARAMNALAMMMLAVASFAVLFAAAPALVRAALSTDSGVGVARGAGHLTPQRAKGAPAPRFEDPSDDEDDDQGPVGDIDSAPTAPAMPREFRGEPAAPGPSSRAGGPGFEPDEPSRPDRPGMIKVGLARKSISLLDGPRDGGLVMGQIKAGEQVVILRESGAWALVVHSGNMGWAHKSEIAVR